jgi:uridine phosphorylase
MSWYNWGFGKLWASALVAACIGGVVAQRTVGENVILEQKDVAVKSAIAVAVRGVESFD